MPIARASMRLRVSALSGVCSEIKSQRGQSSSSRDTLSTPFSSAFSADSSGSKPTTVMPKPRARRATARPTRPKPTTPRVLPSSWVPVKALRSHFPDLRLSLATATLRARASISAMVCSAVETVLPPGVFMTTMPWRVAAGTSMLSTPTPARTMALSRAWFWRTSAVNCVPDRTAIPSASFRAALSAGGSLASLVSTMTSIPFSARSKASPSSASLSVTSTRYVTIRDLLYTRPCQNREAGREKPRRALTSRARHQEARMPLCLQRYPALVLT